jgi:NTP pyrophosphatase (non-canonical NTP hydrolase)
MNKYPVRLRAGLDRPVAFDDYQTTTAETAIYPRGNTGDIMAVNYCAIGLANESGECLGKLKKAFRDNNGEIDEVRRLAMLDELGDVLWYCGRLADELNADLSYVADKNLRKLFDRKERNVISGDGDNR